MKRIGLLFGILALGSSGLAGRAADWPQWRGPNRNGVSLETGLLKEWPKAGPKLLWQVADIGYGFATPSVVGDRIYLLSNRGRDDEFVQALSIHDGKPLWSTHLGKVGGTSYPGAKSTPTVDGNLLYALSSDGDLACLETGSGKVVWQRNVRTELGGKRGIWAYSESPLVDGDTLICTPGGSQATLAALQKQTGSTLWKAVVPGGDPAAYASTIVLDSAGRKQYVQFLQKGLVGIDAKTGQFLWRYNQTSKGLANIPTPIAHEGAIYTSGEGDCGGLVRLKKGPGETILADQVYLQRGLPSAIGGAVLVDGHLYGTNSKALLCVDFATGKVKWQDKCVGTGSVCFADGQLFVHGENGSVAVVDATPNAYREKARFTPPGQPKHVNGVRAWAYPVIANGRLYIRDLEKLWCYDIHDPRATQ
jgi:outer membrane protein assembly factor BamB